MIRNIEHYKTVDKNQSLNEPIVSDLHVDKLVSICPSTVILTAVAAAARIVATRANHQKKNVCEANLTGRVHEITESFICTNKRVFE